MSKDDADIYITLSKIDNVEDVKGFYEVNKENVNDREHFHTLSKERIKAIKAIKQEGVLI